MATVKHWSIFDLGFRRKFALCILAAILLVFCILKIKDLSESDSMLEKYSGWNVGTLIASSKSERSLSFMNLNLFASSNDDEGE